jgi:predicted tellurium resistance membrane protein TerC
MEWLSTRKFGAHFFTLTALEIVLGIDNIISDFIERHTSLKMLTLSFLPWSAPC